MTVQDFSWDTFTSTGFVDAYLFYKAIQPEKKKDEINEQHKGKGNSSKADQLR